MKNRALFVLVVLFAVSCGKKTGDTGGDSTQVTLDATKADWSGVCIYEGVALRSEPSSKDGKWLSGLSLGEKVTVLGETKLDPSSKIEYVKVRLLDGTEGWASSGLIVAKAKPAAITNVSYFYKRPDLSTVTSNSFEALDLVAVTTEQGDWLEVVGKRKKSNGIEKGWIQKGTTSYSDKDVAVASMTARAMAKKNDDERRKGLEAILNNPAVSGSALLSEVQAMVAKSEELPADYRRVTADKAYFHDAPTEEARRAAYVIRGDAVRIVATENPEGGDWYYVQYEGAAGTTEGWVKKVDLQ